MAASGLLRERDLRALTAVIHLYQAESCDRGSGRPRSRIAWRDVRHMVALTVSAV